MVFMIMHNHVFQGCVNPTHKQYLNSESVTLTMKDYSKLMSSDGYKEKYRKDMIRWSEEIRYDFKDCSSDMCDNRACAEMRYKLCRSC